MCYMIFIIASGAGRCVIHSKAKFSQGTLLQLSHLHTEEGHTMYPSNCISTQKGAHPLGATATYCSQWGAQLKRNGSIARECHTTGALVYFSPRRRLDWNSRLIAYTCIFFLHKLN